MNLADLLPSITPTDITRCLVGITVILLITINKRMPDLINGLADVILKAFNLRLAQIDQKIDAIKDHADGIQPALTRTDIEGIVEGVLLRHGLTKPKETADNDDSKSGNGG